MRLITTPPMTWEDLAHEYDKTHNNRPARTLPMKDIFEWAEKQPRIFFLHPTNGTLHKRKGETMSDQFLTEEEFFDPRDIDMADDIARSEASRQGLCWRCGAKSGLENNGKMIGDPDFEEWLVCTGTGCGKNPDDCECGG